MRARASLVALVVLGLSCKEAEPPPPAPGPAPSSIASASTSAASSASITSPDASSPEDAGIDATSAGDATADAAAALYESDGAPLGQTDAFPSVTSAGLQDRVALLFKAILADDPEVARPAFFPLVAYEQVKAIKHPATDYEKRLIAAFARDIHAYHQKLGKDPKAAKLVARLDVPEKKAKWMEPGSEGNKLGYDRVLDSKLIVTLDDGKEVKLDVKSMISWRGEWYVVHLAGFK